MDWSFFLFGETACFVCFSLNNREGGTRTPNTRFWRPLLYQLNYFPKCSFLFDRAAVWAARIRTAKPKGAKPFGVRMLN